MGCFDGYLICSDFDGTFSGGQDLSENIAAVKYFTENGGRFTFATGRGAEFFREKNLFHLVNAPISAFNGSAIYDSQNDRLIRESYFDFSLGQFLNSIKEVADLISTCFVFPNANTCFKGSYSSDYSVEQLKSGLVKIVCVFEELEKADAFKEYVIGHDTFKNSSVLKSWPTGVEINPHSGTKGAALKFIKEYLGNIHTAIGVGDYENDIPLIVSADIGVAVENALDSVKKVADKVILPCNENAIAHLINNLQQLL